MPDVRDPNLYRSQRPGAKDFVKRLATNIWLDQKEIWTSPFHISQENVPWWILAGVGTASLLAADHRTSQALPFSGTSVSVGNNLSRIGQWYSVFPFAGGAYAMGVFRDDPKLKETGMESLEALTDADLVVNVLKVATRRERPKSGDHGGHFEKGGASFPSGHSAQAWALAAVLANEYGNHRWVPYVTYGYAALVSTSRVLAQEHFPSDVLVGGAIGFFVGRYVVHTQHSHRAHSDAQRAHWMAPAIIPGFDATSKTVSLIWSR
jgi:hypothetical protein